MNMFQQELAEAAQRVQMGGDDQPGAPPGFMNMGSADGRAPPNSRPGAPPGMEHYSHEQLLEFGRMLQEGKVPPELAQALGQQTPTPQVDKDGKPIIDEEGGAVVQPTPGFVVKTQAPKVGKVFINMCHHEVVEGMQQQAIPAEQAAQYQTGEYGIRIPLSMGDKREENDKKGDPAMVIDIIWAPEVVEQALKDGEFRQQIIQLAFAHVEKKYSIQLDLRFQIPKMKYKGATVQYQRVRAKKSPKIQEVEMSPEEKAERERKGLEEAAAREAQAEKAPEWKLFSLLKKDQDLAKLDQKYWEALIDERFEAAAGDEEDRWTALKNQFDLPPKANELEEYDGLNHEEAIGMVFVVSLPLLVRGHSIVTRVFEDIISVRVPHIYRIQLGLPKVIDDTICHSYFDCKLRKLFLVLPFKPEPEPEVEDLAEPFEANTESEKPKVIEVMQEPEPVQQDVSQTAASASDDLLFDVM